MGIRAVGLSLGAHPLRVVPCLYICLWGRRRCATHICQDTHTLTHTLSSFPSLSPGTVGPNNRVLLVQVTLYEHGLQTATRAHRDGASEEWVVTCLLHDVGELLSPSNHGSVIAGILEPYVSPACTWVLAHHEVGTSRRRALKSPIAGVFICVDCTCMRMHTY